MRDDSDIAYVMAYEHDVRAVGLGPAWDHILGPNGPEAAGRHLLLGVIGAVAKCLVETGFTEAQQAA